MDRFDYVKGMLKRLGDSEIDKYGYIKISFSSDEDIKHLNAALLEIRFYGYIIDIKGYLKDRWVRPTMKFLREYKNLKG